MKRKLLLSAIMGACMAHAPAYSIVDFVVDEKTPSPKSKRGKFKKRTRNKKR